MPNSRRKLRVLVVGAGASGLPAIKTALEYNFSVICLEKSNDIGGLWRYKETPEDGEGTVMKSTVINTSKEMTAYSDFPPPADEANYMHNRALLNYLRSYAKHFRLLDHIRFRHEVINIQRTNDFNETGQWVVKYKDIGNDKINVEIFDGVMICTGHHAHPYWPEPFAGQELFKGKILHSHSFRTGKDFEDETTVVVGIGNSGGDIAVELSKTSKKVYLSTRSGSWIVNRVWDHGEPSDLAYLNRFTFFVKSLAPWGFQNWTLERKVNKRFDHGRFGLRPAHRLLEAHVTINDELPNRIISGTVVVKPNILKFGERTVIFEDGTSVNDVDSVIFATGYSFDFPLLENGKLIKVVNNRVETLYKFMFPTELTPQNSLAIIGLIQPTGSIMPISEMQCRVFCANLAGEIALPSREEMCKSASRANLANEKRFLIRRRHTIQVYYVTYMDQLAKLIGVKPNIKKYILTDNQLARKLIFHGLVPYQYRLDGPHAWPGARDAIIQMEERVFNCTRTRNTIETDKSKPICKFYVWKIMFS